MLDVSGCGTRDGVVEAAALAANTLLGLAQNNLVANQMENMWNTRQPKAWFGRWNEQRYPDVIFKMVAIETFGHYKYDCTCSRGSSRTYAYVTPSVDDKLINLCPRFFSSPTNGYDSQAGILIHEASHLRAGTKDVVYGRILCRLLAMFIPSWAINNADTYEYFAETPWTGVATKSFISVGRLAEYFSGWVSSLTGALVYW
ncbi:hypothetical protein FRC08_010996 [Ceratobasidium sp. 394]|nr:hypothetical protein FRC08_010996 [Ceratobasidium sp. 394]